VEVSDLRKGILRALDEARREGSARRSDLDRANAAYTAFIDGIAVPLVRQAASVLRAENHAFTVHAPAGGVRLVSDTAPQTFLELELDTRGAAPQVIGRVSVARGRHGVVIDEAPLVAATAVGDLTEDDLAAFLMRAIPQLVLKT
jgi:hypothetical protein